MSGQKLEDAKRAATTFVRLLDLGRDQAALIAFNEQSRVVAGLGIDLAMLERAIDALSVGSGTRIDRALQGALAELLSHRRRPGNQGMIILLSDGAHNGPAVELRRATLEARSLGATIYAVGLGADADIDQLRQIAGPERTYMATDGRELETIYRQIAVSIPCR
jgi:Mg-chelatase subunit ChlD